MASKKKAVARKPAVKSSPKKASVPKRAPSVKTPPRPTVPGVSRQRVYHLTKEIPEHQYFILANGQPVKHVGELAAVLDQLEDHVFNHHVTPDKNDFHNWIKDVFQDVELARKVTGVTDKKRLQLVIYKHMAGHD